MFLVSIAGITHSEQVLIQVQKTPKENYRLAAAAPRELDRSVVAFEQLLLVSRS